MERRRPRKAPARPLVLLADGDDDHTREVYSAALASLGFEVIAADSAEDTFAQVWKIHPDIIVTEVGLPRHDGWGLVEELKDDPRTRNIPIVILTGQEEAALRERAEREGCGALLVKPCLPEELAHALHERLAPESLHERVSTRG